MFTGIIESTGKIVSLKKKKSNLELEIETSFVKELKIGQSVSHNGVCLTVEKVSPSKKNYLVTAIKETLSKTNLGKLKVGDEINLERSLKVGDRLDGHFVQGHVDTKAKIKSITSKNGSWVFAFQIRNLKSQTSNLIIEKGSICINGVSLTVAAVESVTSNLKLLTFSVAIIPHTFAHTNFNSLKVGSEVNIEFDILGKHIQKIISNK